MLIKIIISWGILLFDNGRKQSKSLNTCLNKDTITLTTMCFVHLSMAISCTEFLKLTFHITIFKYHFKLLLTLPIFMYYKQHIFLNLNVVCNWGITDLVNREFFPMKSFVSSVLTLKTVRNVTFWAWISITADDAWRDRYWRLSRRVIRCSAHAATGGLELRSSQTTLVTIACKACSVHTLLL